MKEKVLFAGFGGQGILSLGKIYAEVCIENGFNASWLPSYGPEMRGGTCNCQVVMSDDRILSPIFSKPTIAIIMNQHSLNKFCTNLSRAHTVVINSSLVSIDDEQKQALKDCNIVEVPATDAAMAVGGAKYANIVMLGAYAKHGNELSLDSIKDSISKKFKNKGADQNIQALEAGYQQA